MATRVINVFRDLLPRIRAGLDLGEQAWYAAYSRGRPGSFARELAYLLRVATGQQILAGEFPVPEEISSLLAAGMPAVFLLEHPASGEEEGEDQSGEYVIEVVEPIVLYGGQSLIGISAEEGGINFRASAGFVGSECIRLEGSRRQRIEGIRLSSLDRTIVGVNSAGADFVWLERLHISGFKVGVSVPSGSNGRILHSTIHSPAFGESSIHLQAGSVGWRIQNCELVAWSRRLPVLKLEGEGCRATRCVIKQYRNRPTPDPLVTLEGCGNSLDNSRLWLSGLGPIIRVGAGGRQCVVERNVVATLEADSDHVPPQLLDDKGTGTRKRNVGTAGFPQVEWSPQNLVTDGGFRRWRRDAGVNTPDFWSVSQGRVEKTSWGDDGLYRGAGLGEELEEHSAPDVHVGSSGLKLTPSEDQLARRTVVAQVISMPITARDYSFGAMVKAKLANGHARIEVYADRRPWPSSRLQAEEHLDSTKFDWTLLSGRVDFSLHRQPRTLEIRCILDADGESEAIFDRVQLVAGPLLPEYAEHAMVEEPRSSTRGYATRHGQEVDLVVDVGGRDWAKAGTVLGSHTLKRALELSRDIWVVQDGSAQLPFPNHLELRVDGEPLLGESGKLATLSNSRRQPDAFPLPLTLIKPVRRTLPAGSTISIHPVVSGSVPSYSVILSGQQRVL